MKSSLPEDLKPALHKAWQSGAHRANGIGKETSSFLKPLTGREVKPKSTWCLLKLVLSQAENSAACIKFSTVLFFFYLLFKNLYLT